MKLGNLLLEGRDFLFQLNPTAFKLYDSVRRIVVLQVNESLLKDSQSLIPAFNLNEAGFKGSKSCHSFTPFAPMMFDSVSITDHLPSHLIDSVSHLLDSTLDVVDVHCLLSESVFRLRYSLAEPTFFTIILAISIRRVNP